MYEISSLLSKDNKIDASMISFFYNNYYLFENKEKITVIGFFAKRILLRSINIRILTILNDLITSAFLIFKKPDIVHETYYSHYVYKNSSSKYITTVHDMIWEKFPKFFKYSNLMIKAKKKSIDRSDHIVCVSENTKKDLIDIYSIDEKKISVVYPGFFSTSKIENKFKVKNRIIKDSYILYVGLRGTYKNFLLFVRSFAKSNLKKKFKVVCFGGEHPSDEENQIFEQNEITDDIIFYSGSDEDLANLYSYAEFLIFPSLYEGFGVPPLEAMYFGCPVICSNSSSLPEVVGDAAITFDPENEIELKDKMELLINSKNLRKNLINNGKKRIEKFSWRNCANKNYEVYAKINNE